MKFIRKGGRVIPISDKNEDPKGSKYMEQTSKRDREISKTGDKVTGVSAVVTAGLAVLAKRKKSFALGAGAVALGMFALSSAGHASARSSSADARKGYAKDLKAGRKIKRGNGIGNASEVAYSEAVRLSTRKKK